MPLNIPHVDIGLSKSRWVFETLSEPAAEFKFERIGLTIDSLTRNRLMNRKISQVVVVVDKSLVKFRFFRNRSFLVESIGLGVK